MRQLGSEEYQCLVRALKAARSILDRAIRETTFTQVCNAWERNLHLQGATAVEDRLQDRVPYTLELLRTAGIKVNIDKLDTVDTQKPTRNVFKIILLYYNKFLTP